MVVLVSRSGGVGGRGSRRLGHSAAFEGKGNKQEKNAKEKYEIPGKQIPSKASGGVLCQVFVPGRFVAVVTRELNSVTTSFPTRLALITDQPHLQYNRAPSAER